MNTTSSPLSPVPEELVVRDKPRLLRTLLVYLVLITLLYLALRNAPFAEIWSTLSQLRLWQIGVLFIINSGVIFAITARWWIIVRSDNPSVPFLPLVRYRLSTFGISYFTPGPQVGGEPLQIYYLQKNHGLTFARSTSAVIMDKLIELLGNSVMIVAGLTAAIRVGMVSRNQTLALGSLVPLAAILVIPLIHLSLLYRGQYPLSRLLRAASSIVGNRNWVRLIIVSERMAASFTRRRLPAVVGAFFFSILALAGTLLEYALMTTFLGAPLTFAQNLAGLTSVMLAFILPLPGGLGALEASQVYALTRMGYVPAIGISLSLLIRARDLMNAGLGLLLAGKLIRHISR
ncbi:MAG: lysylphosphatidylglycerol synthase transmembrane domain-containing protein [Bacteroidota bacterium]